MKIKTQKPKVNKQVTTKQLNTELKRLKKEISEFKKINTEMGNQVDTICFKLRRDVPIIFMSPNNKEIFRTFNINHLPKIGAAINLTPTELSCCLNHYLMHEFDLSESELFKQIETNTTFSFIVQDISTNLTVIESHPDNEWEDANGINYEDDYSDFNYQVILEPNNRLRKEVLIEKFVSYQ